MRINGFWLALGALIWGGSVAAAELTPGLTPADLRVFGHSDAQTSIYVFSSLTCPHCAVFHQKVMPSLKEKYADTGVAKIVFVDMPFDPKAMTGTLIARCVTPAHYESFMDAMYQKQSFWSRMPNARDLMTNYAKALGESEQEINKCLVDKELQKTVSTQRDNLARMYKVRGMPTVVAVKEGQTKSLVGTDTEVILTDLNNFLGVQNDKSNNETGEIH